MYEFFSYVNLNLIGLENRYRIKLEKGILIFIIGLASG